MSIRKRVALLIETSNAYARGLLRGINRYQQVHEYWSIFLPEQERGAAPPTWLSRWRCDGIIARVENESIAEFVQQYGVPTVDVSSARLIEGIPWVETNDEAIGEMVAEYLHGKSLDHFAYYHDPAFNWSVWRMDSFSKAVRKLRKTVHIRKAMESTDPDYSWSREFEELCRWLLELPKPIGIMACYDIKARQILDACMECDIAVPEQVAVVGVDNDALVCEACNPPLSSVALNAHQTGYRAAGMLNRMMNGEDVPSDALLIDPIELVERLSTDTVAVEDQDVARALKFIRENAARNIRVADVLQKVDISRRKLESRFQKIVGRTPHQEIQHRRLERIKHLLSKTDLTIAQIAELTGYEHPEYLCVAFQRETGNTTTEFRKQRSERPV